jgi:hypothetical protein
MMQKSRVKRNSKKPDRYGALRMARACLAVYLASGQFLEFNNQAKARQP